MKPWILLVFSLLLLVSCIPLIKESRPPQVSHPYLDRLFPRDDEQVVIIPVWQKYPIFMSEKSIRSDSSLCLGSPVFTKAVKFEHVNEQISGKTSAGLIIGPGGGIGRGVFFYGYIIASESGNMLLLDNSQDHLDMTSFGVVTVDNKNELIDLMTSGHHSKLKDFGLWKFFDGKEIRIWFNFTERDRIVSFLSNVKIAN
ncbi:MAG: hypothetical protein RQ754_16635 [Desulfuromonadales bacterium]|nr:hypothetical protein [Desulfuromonadales bacterium]